MGQALVSDLFKFSASNFLAVTVDGVNSSDRAGSSVARRRAQAPHFVDRDCVPPLPGLISRR